MKKILLGLLASLFVVSSAHADACSTRLTGLFTAYQATRLCSLFSSTITGTLAGAGTTQADAAAITFQDIVRVTGADGTVGVKLPALSNVSVGQSITVINTNTVSLLKVYSNDAAELISGQAGTTAISLAAKLTFVCIKYDATNWYCGKNVLPY